MKKWSKVIPILIVIIVLFIISGYRFTALSVPKETHSYQKMLS